MHLPTAIPLILAALAATPTASRAQAPAAPAAQRELTLADLTQRRDLWPAKVKLGKDLRLSGGVTLRAGQEVGLQELQGTTAVLDNGQFLFDVPASDTDVLARASALAASLSPEQLALTYAELPKKSELWPVRVTLNIGIGFDNGLRLDPGQEVALRGFTGADLNVFARGHQTFFTLEPWSTDVLARARERLKLPPEQREPYFIRAVEASIASAAGATERPLANADYVLVYKGRKPCGNCAQFVPQLARFYARVKPELPRFEVLFLSQDATAPEASAYAQEAKLPGQMIDFDRRIEAAELASVSCQYLPGAFVYDRSGKLVDSNQPAGGTEGALAVLDRLERRLREAPAR